MKFGRFSTDLGPQARELLAAWVLACLMGGVTVWLWWAPEGAAVQALETEIGQMHSRLRQMQASTTDPSAVHTLTPPQWPMPPDQTAASTWLQQGAQTHGLKVQAMHAQPVALAAELPEQSLRWRLQGRWSDWLALEAVLDVQAPWWVVDQWQVSPDEVSAGEVRIELQGRLGLLAAALVAHSVQPADWPAWSHDRSPVALGAELFALPPQAMEVLAPQASTPAKTMDPVSLSADPRLWPISELQLLGMWWQEGTAHAVLGRGLMQVTVVQGQRVGREAYQVRRITPAGVELRALHRHGQSQFLTLKGTGGP